MKVPILDYFPSLYSDTIDPPARQFFDCMNTEKSEYVLYYSFKKNVTLAPSSFSIRRT